MHRAIFVLGSAEFYRVLFGFMAAQFESGAQSEVSLLQPTALSASLLAGPGELQCRPGLPSDIYMPLGAHSGKPRYTHHSIKKTRNCLCTADFLGFTVCVCEAAFHGSTWHVGQPQPKPSEGQRQLARGMRPGAHPSTLRGPPPAPQAQKRSGNVRNYNWPFFQQRCFPF